MKEKFLHKLNWRNIIIFYKLKKVKTNDSGGGIMASTCIAMMVVAMVLC